MKNKDDIEVLQYYKRYLEMRLTHKKLNNKFNTEFNYNQRHGYYYIEFYDIDEFKIEDSYYTLIEKLNNFGIPYITFNCSDIFNYCKVKIYGLDVERYFKIGDR